MMSIKNDQKIKRILLLLPISAFYILIIGGGLFETIKESLWYDIDGRSGVDYYIDLLRTEGFIKGFLYSFYLAFTASMLATFFGVVTSYFIITSKNQIINRITNVMLRTGVILPYLYVIYLAILYLSRTGFLSRLLYNVGILKDYNGFPQLLNTSAGIGMIWVYVFKGMPFVALFVLNIMSKVSSRYSNVSKNLGANKWQILKRIYIPLSSGSIVWSSTILFAYAFGSFEVPYFLSSFKPEAISVITYKLFTGNSSESYRMAMASNVLIFIFGTVMVLAYSFFIKKVTGGRRIEK